MNRLHIPSIVLGIVGIASLWRTAGISGLVCGIIGIVLSKKAKRDYNTTAGFVLSLISLIVGAVYFTAAAVLGVLFGLVILNAPEGVPIFETHISSEDG